MRLSSVKCPGVLLVSVLFCVMGGCTMKPHNPHGLTPDQAGVVKGYHNTWSNTGTFFTHVDGVRMKSFYIDSGKRVSPTELVLKPGKHSINILEVRDDLLFVYNWRGQLEVDLEAGHTYKIRMDKVGKNGVFSVHDITPVTKEQVADTKRKVELMQDMSSDDMPHGGELVPNLNTDEEFE